MKKTWIISGAVLLITVTMAGFAFGGVTSGKYSGSQQSLDMLAAQTKANDVMVIDAKVAAGGYPRITVEVNKPVRINFKVDETSLNGCNNEIIIPEWNISKKLTVGDNFVEFTPAKTGTFTYSCWMGMLSSSISVVEKDSGAIGAAKLPESANDPSGCSMTIGAGGGCCGVR